MKAGVYSRLKRILLFSVMGTLLISGCKQPAPVSPPQVEAAKSSDPPSATKECAKPVAEAPLLLDEDPVAEASSGSTADNSRCFVCHVNYMEEKLAVTHAQAKIGCADCHGVSDAHIADESWASGGNGTAPDIMYPRDKINSSCLACHTREKINTPEHQPLLTGAADKVCTDCHDQHRLPQRRCKWK
jgi:hypothetical protein